MNGLKANLKELMPKVTEEQLEEKLQIFREISSKIEFSDEEEIYRNLLENCFLEAVCYYENGNKLYYFSATFTIFCFECNIDFIDWTKILYKEGYQYFYALCEKLVPSDYWNQDAVDALESHYQAVASELYSRLLMQQMGTNCLYNVDAEELFYEIIFLISYFPDRNMIFDALMLSHLFYKDLELKDRQSLDFGICISKQDNDSSIEVPVLEEIARKIRLYQQSAKSDFLNDKYVKEGIQFDTKISRNHREAETRRKLKRKYMM